MKKENKNKLVKTTAVSLLLVGAVIGLVMIANMNPQEIISSIGQRGWSTVATAEGNPGAGASGVLQIYIYPHQAVPATAYAANLSTATAYGYADNLNTSCGTDVPFSTAFDIVVKCRFNVTHAYNVTAAAWVDAWVRANITCANLAIGAYTAMTWVQITNTTEYMWGNFYINNGGAGYQISHGQNINVTLFRVQAYF